MLLLFKSVFLGFLLVCLCKNKVCSQRFLCFKVAVSVALALEHFAADLWKSGKCDSLFLPHPLSLRRTRAALSFGADSSVTFQQAAFCCVAAGWGWCAGSFITPSTQQRLNRQSWWMHLASAFSFPELWMIFCRRQGKRQDLHPLLLGGQGKKPSAVLMGLYKVTWQRRNPWFS